MRTLYIVLMTILFFFSCGKKETSIEAVLATRDVKKIREKKAALDKQQKELAEQIQQLNDTIAKLDPSKNIPLITTITAGQQVFKHYLELQGNVMTKQNVLVYPEVSGLLEKVYVKEGQQVSKGQVLGRIDDAGATQQLAQLEVVAELAKTTFERQKRLWDNKIGSEIEFLQSKTNYESTKNQVIQAKKQLAKFNIRAPFSGVIDDIIKDPGTVVSPGPNAEIFRIVNLNNMYIETDVPEAYITNITKGKNVKIEFPVLGTSMNTKIRQVGSFINPENRTFKIAVSVPNKNNSIKPNLTAKLKINDYTNEKAILIPQSIVSENSQGQQYVYVIKEIEKVKNPEGKERLRGITKQVVIETGKTQGDLIEVLSEINIEDQIVNEGARSVKEGQLVTIKEERK
ncbi:MAG: efflux RND transporter periplasmic adaptor subunit [Flavobacteriaceae bacterium]|nr:MAG: efflux RND transporter periplasmic adaptor subunit [Flavobacteriaceae bacterium]